MEELRKIAFTVEIHAYSNPESLKEFVLAMQKIVAEMECRCPIILSADFRNNYD